MNIDCKLLAEQRQSLLKVIDRYEALHAIDGSKNAKTIADHMTGILHLLDEVGDKALEQQTVDSAEDFPWTLYVSMFTDDDCALIYEDRQYCYYADTLKFIKGFHTKASAIDHLEMIYVKPGGKASTWTHEWLEEAADKLRKGGSSLVSFSGNQEYEIELRKNK